jgi:3-hydroxyacyl-[acyl-carrier-protein] dehydratase
MLVHRNDIQNFIPQRAPIVMIDNLIEADEHHAVTSFKVQRDNVFSADGCFMEPGLVENIAQTAAAHAGYQCVQKKLPVPLGFIAAIRKLSIQTLPVVDSELKTTVRIVNNVMNVTIIEGKVEVSDRMICQCEMRIFIKEN